MNKANKRRRKVWEIRKKCENVCNSTQQKKGKIYGHNFALFATATGGGSLSDCLANLAQWKHFPLAFAYLPFMIPFFVCY
jgi:hypothetical protein